jgi:hypothetical protein
MEPLQDRLRERRGRHALGSSSEIHQVSLTINFFRPVMSTCTVLRGDQTKTR